MRVSRTWTISLPPEMSRLAQEVARQESRTKSELIREALRLYVAQRGQPLVLGAGERLARVGELADVYRQRHGQRPLTEDELRREFRPIRQFHERLKRLAL